MKRMMAPYLVALSLCLVTPSAQAADQTPEDMARDGLAKLLSALDLFIGSIPQYETPEILPNGDIIIRRIQPKDGDNGDRSGGSSADDKKDSI